MSTPVIGFDLDMTLLDAREGLAASYRDLVAATGVQVDIDAVLARLGPPLREELANWFPPEQVEDAVRQFRGFYSQHLAGCTALPGAAGAVAAVRRHGGRVIVVTSKLGRLAEGHLDHLGLVVDEVLGDRFGAGKTEAITASRMSAYVGDHTADMAAAGAAGVTAVGVSTGPCSQEDLRAAGASAVLASLLEFPSWLDGYLADPTRAPGVADVGHVERLVPGSR